MSRIVKSLEAQVVTTAQTAPSLISCYDIYLKKVIGCLSEYMFCSERILLIFRPIWFSFTEQHLIGPGRVYNHFPPQPLTTYTCSRQLNIFYLPLQKHIYSIDLLAASPLASRGFALRGLINLIFHILDLKRKSKKKIFLGGLFFIFLGGVGGVPPPKKIA